MHTALTHFAALEELHHPDVTQIFADDMHLASSTAGSRQDFGRSTAFGSCSYCPEEVDVDDGTTA